MQELIIELLETNSEYFRTENPIFINACLDFGIYPIDMNKEEKDGIFYFDLHELLDLIVPKGFINY